MKLDRTSLIGVVVCVILYIGYESYLNKKYPNRYDRTKTTTSKVVKKEAAPTAPTKATNPSAHPEVALASKQAKRVDVKRFSS